jgi:rod shape determining protein RodA
VRQRKNIIQNLDWLTIGLYFALVLIGWISIYAAEYTENSSILDMNENYGKQLLWIGTSIVIILGLLIIDAKFYSTFSFIIYLATLFLLIAVLLFGKEIAGSKSWFQIGGFSLQPAEFAKFATSLAIAKHLSKFDLDVIKLKPRATSAIIIILPALLILLQGDTGSAMVYSALILVLFREGLSGILLIIGLIAAALFIIALLINKFIIIGILAAISGLIFWVYRNKKGVLKWVIGLYILSAGFVFSVDYAFENVLEPHHKNRINVLLGIKKDIRGAGYNVHQSKIAIGSGGITGKGFLNGTQTKFKFVPEQSTDFIFCTIGEEWGFLGSLVLIMLFVALLIRLIVMAERQRSQFSRIYGYAVASIIFFHFAVNIGMTIGLFPVIGIPLPFISYGGSSLWGFTILLFIFVKLDSVRLELL